MSINQILNIIQTVLSLLNGAIIALLTQVGCLPGLDGKLVCTVSGISWLSIGTLATVAAVSNFVKFIVLPWLAPGGLIRNLFGDKAVVVPASSPAATSGTVAPSAVRPS